MACINLVAGTSFAIGASGRRRRRRGLCRSRLLLLLCVLLFFLLFFLLVAPLMSIDMSEIDQISETSQGRLSGACQACQGVYTGHYDGVEWWRKEGHCALYLSHNSSSKTGFFLEQLSDVHLSWVNGYLVQSEEPCSECRKCNIPL